LPKGWKRWEGYKGIKGMQFIRYDSVASDNFVLISDKGSYWRVYSYEGGLEGNFKTKSQALRVANLWMRRHPSG